MNATSLTELLISKPSFCDSLYDKVEEYFQNEENRIKYEEWYAKKYGKPDNRS